jgi:hypothetical protein
VVPTDCRSPARNVVARINRAVLTSPARDWSEWPTMQTKDNNFFDKPKQQKLKVFDKCFPKNFWQKCSSEKLLAEKI